MITLFVDKKDVDKTFKIKDLMEFTRKHNAKVIIRGVMTLKNGGVVEWVN